MKIISVDLPWKAETSGRRALAIADLNGKIEIKRSSDDEELLALVSSSAEPRSIILLDVPIEGCQHLSNAKGKRFRPVDYALAHQGIWIQPSYQAENRGEVLKKRLENKTKRITVVEIYPYAVYKFLAYLKDRQLLRCLHSDTFAVLLSDGFRTYRPPKYKRDKTRTKRQESMRYLHSLLTDLSNLSIGFNFSSTLRYHDDSYSLNELSNLSDEYDACLGAIVGVYHAKDCRYACIAGDSNSGNILLLADRWLASEMGKEVSLS